MTISSKFTTDPDLLVAVILLAAGEGSRMGSIPKALLKKDGKTFLEHFCVAVSQIRPIELIVVTGYHANQIEATLNGFKDLPSKIRVIRNPNPQRGQASSVRVGLEALDADFDVLIMALSDQPYIGIAELRLLLAQFEMRSASEDIVMPIVNGQRGNPVLFSQKVVGEILSTPKMVCRAFMDQNPQRIFNFETENRAFIQDVDTPLDILESVNIAKN